MMRLALGGLIVAGLATAAGANGRPPAASSIHFRQTHESDVVVGLTFGAVVSHDAGATWHWFCEKAIGYGGMYDPSYAYSQSGAIFATTFDGLKANRDGCTFAATPPGTTFMSRDQLGPDHALYIAAGDPADAKIYKSTDDGATFPTSASPGQNNDWWQSIAIAPSDPSRVYLSGYRFLMTCINSTNVGAPCTTNTDCPGTNGKCDSQKQFLLFSSSTGGTSFSPMSITGLVTSTNSAIDIVGISATDPNLLYAKVSLENGTNTEGVYKSINAGGSWTKILTKSEQVAFVARANGDLVAGTLTGGIEKSINAGMTWTPVAGGPHVNCLTENAAGEIWACTLNYDIPGSPPIPADGFGIMKSTDLTAWTGVLKYQDITGPVDCAAGTLQRDMCQGDGPTGGWCSLEMQLGITSTVIDCSFAADVTPPPPKGCCDTGRGSGPAALGLGLVVGILVVRPRRRRDQS